MRKIIHIDMDYFFAQVEERDNPSLRDRPVGIGGITNGRGVLCTSNYIARKFGVKSAMPTALALKLCPNLVLVKPQFQKYKETSDVIFQIFSEFSDLVQPLSIDEAFIDVTDCSLFNNDAIKIAQEIRIQILKRTGLTASAGVSYNKFLAKIASDIFKPNGMAVIRAENVASNIAHFPISKMPGVGKVMEKRMLAHGIKTFGELQQFKKLNLINLFGDYGVRLFDYSRGIDHREVSSSRIRKSLSVERTFSNNIEDESELLIKLEGCFLEMQERLKKHHDRFTKNIFVKIKNSDFSQTTIEARGSIEFSEFKYLFKTRFQEIENKAIRLVGTGVRFITNENKFQLELPISS